MMEGRSDPWILLPDNSRWSPEKRKENPSAWQSALVATKGLREPARCLCLQQGERPLYVTTRSTGLLLARHPGTGALHHPNCSFYASPVKQSGLGAYDNDDIIEKPDGTKKVRLAVPLAKIAQKPDEAAGTSRPSSSSSESQGSMTLLGLLNLIWEESGLHRWHPNMAGKRSWAAVRNAALSAAANIEIAKGELSDRLVVMAAQRGEGLRNDVMTDLRNKIAWGRKSKDKKEFLLLLAEMRTIYKGPKSSSIVLAHGGKDFPVRLFCSHELADKWAKSFPDAARAVQAGGDDRVIGLFLAECRDKDGQIMADVLAGALMVTTPEFIPFSSSYERTVAGKLIAEGRWFEKPLRYDATKEWCFPDFVLFDTSWPRLPMEVYGRNNDPDYARRREEKRALYQALYGSDRHWEWIVDPAYPEAVPGFTPKHQTASA